jgi:hypothetical protein
MDLQDAYAAEIAARRERESDENLCVCCMDKQADHAVLPCGHKCVCADDTRAVVRMGTCPVCRATVRSCAKIW